MALANGIDNYIELNCSESTKEYIKNSIDNSDLINIINKEINYDAVNVLAEKSLFREVCLYYNTYKPTYNQICSKFDIEPKYIHHYIKEGKGLGIIQ